MDVNEKGQVSWNYMHGPFTIKTEARYVLSPDSLHAWLQTMRPCSRKFCSGRFHLCHIFGSLCVNYDFSSALCYCTAELLSSRGRPSSVVVRPSSVRPSVRRP